jgi:ligand-binding sensor domain-containing protein
MSGLRTIDSPGVAASRRWRRGQRGQMSPLARLALLFCLLLAALCLLLPGLTDRLQPPPAAAQSSAVWRTYAHGDDVRTISVQGSMVWAGTAGGGLVRWEPGADTFTQFLRPQDGLPGNAVRDVALDTAGNLWVATDRGLGKRAADGTWTVYDRVTTGGKLTSDDITAVAVAGGGAVWVGMAQFWDGVQWTGGGVARFQSDQWAAYSVQDGLASNTVTDIAIDKDTQEVWVTMGQYRRLETNTNTGEPVWQLQKGGISYFRAGAWTTYQQSDTDSTAYPRSAVINAVAIDSQGRKWFATTGQGLEVLEGESTWSGFTLSANGLGDNNVLALSIDDEDHVWAATADSSGNGTEISVLNHKGTIGTTSDDTWQHFTTADGLPSDTIRAIDAISPDLVWLGAVDPAGDGYGLVRYQSGTFTTFSTTDQGGLPSNFITAISFDRDGRAWVGTASRGVAVQGSDGQWTRYTAENTDAGLPTDLVRGITVDDRGRVWVAVEGHDFDYDALRYTDGGVGVFDGTTWRAFHLEDTYTLGQQVTVVTANKATGTFQVPVGFADQNEADAALASRYLKFQGDETLYRYMRYIAADGAIEIAPSLAQSVQAGTPVLSVRLGLADNRAVSIGFGLGRVWIGTGASVVKLQNAPTPDRSASGLSVYNTGDEGWEDVLTYPTLPSNLVIAISVAGDTVWLATSYWGTSATGGGVAQGEGGVNWTTYNQENSPGLVAYLDDVRSVVASSDGTAWAGGFDYQGSQFGTAWPRVDAAVNRFRNDAWEHWTFKDDGYVSALAIDAQGRTWLGTSRDGRTPADINPQTAYGPHGGVRLFANDEWLAFNPDNSGLVGNDIRAISVAPDGERWFGTYRSGISAMLGGEPPIPPTATSTPIETSTPMPTPSSTRPATAVLPGVDVLTTPFPTGTPIPPSQVPEANSLWLLGSGLMSLAGYAALRMMAHRR